MTNGTPSPSREPICKIAYEESIRGLQIQDATLDSIRRGATTLGSLGGLAATFLGKEVFSKAHPMDNVGSVIDLLVIVAIAFLSVSLLTIVMLYRPRNGWIFYSSATSILDQFAGPLRTIPVDVTYDKLARFNEINQSKNDKNLKQMFWLLRFLIACVVVQITAWLVALALLRR